MEVFIKLYLFIKMTAAQHKHTTPNSPTKNIQPNIIDFATKKINAQSFPKRATATCSTQQGIDQEMLGVETIDAYTERITNDKTGFIVNLSKEARVQADKVKAANAKHQEELWKEYSEQVAARSNSNFLKSKDTTPGASFCEMSSEASLRAMIASLPLQIIPIESGPRPPHQQAPWLRVYYGSHHHRVLGDLLQSSLRIVRQDWTNRLS
jgi:hypothetical protein